ncbi:serine/threonine-protein phosphatase 4 regulatory subunit 2-a [Plakobranchus ocellatus]|uniref:Serine/threonine-protein phosphatase 4 regulatory subunit 2-a n=1 Tax=Plakobranchus ocellatus TaxID=259542 RepID=A0AAV4DKC1_9GAST|nr:serine/threonine-protein phosphatase 4 regulatory subunit 2-a [Plakobranchus ocellatus]
MGSLTCPVSFSAFLYYKWDGFTSSPGPEYGAPASGRNVNYTTDQGLMSPTDFEGWSVGFYFSVTARKLACSIMLWSNSGLYHS